MALSFGVTVLPDPPYSRMIELIQLAEEHGFAYAWTYDSHVLWQESFPILALVADRTSTIKLGHMVTNPGTREPTVLASAYATLHDISDGRMVMGIGRGDSARRYIGQQPVKVAEFEEALKMIKPFMNGKPVTWNGKELELKWVRPEPPEIPMHVAGYGPKALAVGGRQGDGIIIQLADPEIIQWIMATARKAAEEAGRDPAALKCIVGAPSGLRRPAGRARAGAVVPGDGLEPRHGPGRPLRQRRELRAAGADGLRRGAQVLRLQRALARRRGARRVRHRRDLRPLLRDRRHDADQAEAARARRNRRRPVQRVPDDERAGGDAAGLRRRRDPEFAVR